MKENIFRKNYFVVLVSIMIVMCTVLYSQNQGNDNTSDLAPIDTSMITDPALKTTLEEIDNKLKAVNEYYCVVNVTTLVEKGELSYVEEQCFKKPNLFFSKLTQINHILQEMKGGVTFTVVDGTSVWKYIRNAPGSGEEMAKRFKGKLPQDQIEKMIKRYETPKIYKYNVKRLNEAGFSEEDITQSKRLLKPFKFCDMKMVKLLQEDDTVWIFSAKSNKEMMGIDSVQIKINKINGILQEVAFFKADGNKFSTETISDVKLNPVMADSKFQFSPIPGVEVIDDTENIIQSLRRQIK